MSTWEYSVELWLGEIEYYDFDLLSYSFLFTSL